MNRFDNFNGSDDPFGLHDRAPSDGGSHWIAPSSGNAGINNNAAYFPSPNTDPKPPVLLETDSIQGRITYTVTTTNRNIIWYLKYIDENNHIKVEVDYGSVVIKVVIGGVELLSGRNKTIQVGSFIDIRTVLESETTSNLIVFINGAHFTELRYTDHGLDAATKVGFSFSYGALKLEEFNYVDNATETYGYLLKNLDYELPLTLSSIVNITTDQYGESFFNVPAGVTEFTVTVNTILDEVAEPIERIILDVSGIVGIGIITEPEVVVEPEQLEPLTEFVLYETPYEMLSSDQRTASATGGAYVGAVALRNPANVNSNVYNLWHCATNNGTYTLVASDIIYAAGATLEGDISYDHRELTIRPKSDYPTSIAALTQALMENITTGAKEFVILRDIKTTVIEGETAISHPNTGVGAYYTPPIRVEENEDGRLFILTNKAMDTTLRTTSECFYKFQPKSIGGAVLDLADIPPVRLEITNRAASPNYPRDVAFTFNIDPTYGTPYQYFPETLSGDQTYIRLNLSSRTAETTPSSFFEPSGLTEVGNQLKVDVRRNRNGSVIRTLTASGSDTFVLYSYLNKRADLLEFTTHYSAYIQNGAYKSLPFVSVIEQAQPQINIIQSVTAAIDGATLVITLNTEAAGGNPNGDGTERFFVWVDIGGTVLSKLNLAAKTYNSVDVTALEEFSEGSEFYLQVTDPDIHPIVITIPYTAAGATGSIKIKAGAPNSSREVSITI